MLFFKLNELELGAGNLVADFSKSAMPG